MDNEIIASRRQLAHGIVDKADESLLRIIIVAAKKQLAHTIVDEADERLLRIIIALCTEYNKKEEIITNP